MRILAAFLLFTAAVFTGCQPCETEQFASDWGTRFDSRWAGPGYWANRVQDWRISEGRLECTTGDQPMRTVHLLTGEISHDLSELHTEVTIGRSSNPAGDPAEGFAGFLIGAGALDVDYRARAQVHHAQGNNGGLAAVVRGDGSLALIDNADDLNIIAEAAAENAVIDSLAVVTLTAHLKPKNNFYDVTLTLQQNGKEINTLHHEGISAARLTGNLALVSHLGADTENNSFRFFDWTAGGPKLASKPEQAYGPVLGALYTLSRGTMKLTAQMPPLGENEYADGRLEIERNGEWVAAATAEIIRPGWTMTFKAENWDDTRETPYRIVYELPVKEGCAREYTYSGTIKADPQKDEIVVAGFTGNYNGKSIMSWRPDPDHHDFSHNTMWFPHNEVIEAVKVHNPDLLVYTGDQIYEGSYVSPDKSGDYSSYLDYLNKWLLFCWAHERLTRDIPAVVITDDHDVYQINYWGAGGKKAREFPEADSWEEMIAKLPEKYQDNHHMYRHDGGGYEMPADWVNMVQRTQCSHLPDPVDPAPVAQGIEVYFTDMLYGGISFAVLEDRKFKSAPEPLLPEANVRNGFPLNPRYDVRNADHPDAVLLGDRQLAFLDEWAADWQGAHMKVALSATIFSCTNSVPEGNGTIKLDQVKNLKKGEIPTNYEPSEDMDTNGWPQSGRNRALEALRKGHAFMLAGDQHLGSIVHHGIDEWDDAGWSFCVPAIGNIAPRRWFTPEPGLNHVDSLPPYTGNHFDAFGNRMNVWAASNPYETGMKPDALYDRATGYGIVRLNKKTQEITMECWPRFADPADPYAEQYDGWPKTITVADNYGREAAAWLPTLKFEGLEQPPVVQVIDENGEIVYTIRAKEFSFTPKVFAEGIYTVETGEPGKEMKTINGLEAAEEQNEELVISF